MATTGRCDAALTGSILTLQAGFSFQNGKKPTELGGYYGTISLTLNANNTITGTYTDATTLEQGPWSILFVRPRRAPSGVAR